MRSQPQLRHLLRDMSRAWHEHAAVLVNGDVGLPETRIRKSLHELDVRGRMDSEELDLLRSRVAKVAHEVEVRVIERRVKERGRWTAQRRSSTLRAVDICARSRSSASDRATSGAPSVARLRHFWRDRHVAHEDGDAEGEGDGLAVLAASSAPSGSSSFARWPGAAGSWPGLIGLIRLRLIGEGHTPRTSPANYSAFHQVAVSSPARRARTFRGSAQSPPTS